MPKKLGALLKRAQTAAEKNPELLLYRREKFAAAIAQEREAAIAQWYRQGGTYYLNWVKKHYRTHEGKFLDWTEPYGEELYLLLGNPWVEGVYIEKAAQCGMSEAFISLAGFCLADVRIPLGFGFEERQKQRKMVAERIQPAFDFCQPIQSLQAARKALTARQDIDNKEAITVAGIALNLWYAGTQDEKKQAESSTYQAPARLRSFPACFMLLDEYTLYPKGIVDIAMARMARSELPTQPIRAGSTPSYEGSFSDIKIKQARYLFQWHCVCPHCDRGQFLSPFGNFLQAVETAEEGVKRTRFVNRLGRPLKWFHSSANPDGLADWQLREELLEEAIATAYVGCSYCGGNLSWEVRSAGEFRDRHTNQALLPFLDAVTASQKPADGAVGLRLPKLASYTFRAPERIKRLIESDKPEDEIQQFLGLPFTLGAGKIAASEILACRNLPLPDREPDLIVMGVDQGKAYQHAVALRWWFGDDKDATLRWRKAKRELFWYGDLSGWNAIADKARDLGATLVGIDADPEFNAAAEFALKYPPKSKGVGVSLWKATYQPRCDRLVANSIFNDMGWEIVDEEEDCCWARPKNRQALAVLELVPTLRQANVALDINPKRRYPNSKQLGIYLIDEVDLKHQNFKRMEKPVQGTRKETRIGVYSLSRDYGLDKVRESIYDSCVSFPEELDFNPKDKSNLILHYTTSDRSVEDGWGKGDPDHYFHAHSFANIVTLIHMSDPGVHRASVTSIRR